MINRSNLNKKQQKEFDKLSPLEQEFYEPKRSKYMNSAELMEVFKEAYQDDDILDLLYKDDPSLKSAKKP